VYSAGYRNPAVLAKSLVTIDHLSNGRLEVGIGAGWYEEEYNAYGIPFEPFNVRLRRMTRRSNSPRAVVERVHRLRRRVLTLRNARCDPKPMQRAPRIWVGAKGPKALEAAARYGDGWNANFMSPDDFGRSCAYIKEHASSPLTIGATLPLILSEGQAFEHTLVTATASRPSRCVRQLSVVHRPGRRQAQALRRARRGMDHLGGAFAVRPRRVATIRE
jgi:alkanesulfonate monooxygenase SsuD/methylene tetrahydromethanopterin reductase-like flavin-dependent oxidoreductase (luciferase family)